MLSETIAAISTATGEAGIGIVRLSGDNAISIVDSIFKPFGKESLLSAKNRHMSYGYIYDKETLIDEVLVVKMVAPHTYTREDIVEINCHGGIISVRKILNLVLDKGARLADPGEFTKRAFLNGRLDLSQAEAVIDLINSKSDIAYEMSIKQLEGDLSGIIFDIKESVMKMTALIVANIDFPEDEIDKATYASLREDSEKIIEKLDKLINSANRGKIMRDGIETTILGKPNVGKSSLLNGLLREERAIVTDIPGTTRDVITDYLNLDGILLKLTDTAGIRETEDTVERIGVEIARKSVDKSDLIIAIFDGSRKFSSEDYEIMELIADKKSIILINKNDLERQVTDEEIQSLLKGKPYIDISVLGTGEVKKIEEAIKEIFFEGELSDSKGVYVNNLRHLRLLKAARESMIEVLNDINEGVFLDLLEVNLEDVLSSLGEITGETSTEDVLDKVFSEFCIGK